MNEEYTDREKEMRLAELEAGALLENVQSRLACAKNAFNRAIDAISADILWCRMPQS